jgi:hypothetical protein
LFVITVYFGVDATVPPIPSSVFALPGCSEFEERDRRCEAVVELTISVLVGGQGAEEAAERQPASIATPSDTYRRLLDQ